MIILTMRTDKPEAEIGLFENDKKLTYKTWLAHRQLSETIHLEIEELLKSRKLTWQNIGGIVCFEGPGSFTGLRIGLTVANALAYGLEIPIVATGDKNWQASGIKKLLTGENQKIVMPKYGAPVRTTKPRK